MLKVTENDGILGHIEYEQFKSHSINVKFFGQMFAAIGGATFFGLLMETAGAMLGATQAAALAAQGIALEAGTITTLTGALGATLFSPVGIGFLLLGAACVYMAQRFFYESTVLDQDFQAKKIAAATSRAQEIGIAQTLPEPTKTHTNPPGMAAHEQHVQESPHETKWAEKIQPRDHTEKHAEGHEPKPHERSIPKPHVDSWAEEVRHADQHHDEHAARTIH